MLDCCGDRLVPEVLGRGLGVAGVGEKVGAAPDGELRRLEAPWRRAGLLRRRTYNEPIAAFSRRPALWLTRARRR